MIRSGTILFVVLVAFAGLLCGCGGDGDGGGGGGTPVNIVGTWVGPMTHRVIDNNAGTDITVTYTAIFYILWQGGNKVSGKMQLGDPSHVGFLDGTMSGSRFNGTRSSSHVAQLKFDVSGNTLTGTFRFVGAGLDETGNYTCTKQ